mgnify:FL=1
MLTPHDAKATATTAYVFCLPLVLGYMRLWHEAIEPSSPCFTGGFGRWSPPPAESSPTAVSAWLDLRHTACSVGCGAASNGRFRSVRIVDLWGQVAGDVQLDSGEARVIAAPPRWVGTVRSDTAGVVRCESAVVRCETECDEPVQTVPGHVPDTDPANGGHTDWCEPHDDVLGSDDFWSAAARALPLTRPDPRDRAVLAGMSEMGVSPGHDWSPDRHGAAVTEAIGDGVDHALTELLQRSGDGTTHGERPPADGPRDYVGRAMAALRWDRYCTSIMR